MSAQETEYLHPVDWYPGPDDEDAARGIRYGSPKDADWAAGREFGDAR